MTWGAFRRNGGLERWERASEWPMLGLSLLFAAILILPYAYPLDEQWERALWLGNLVLWAAFLLEYLIRLYLALDRWRFVRTRIPDLLMVAVPFLRPLRLLRLVIVVAAFLRRARGGVRGRVLAVVVLGTVLLMSTAAVMVYGAEQHAEGATIRTLGDALWWALATVTTVGYGDSFPVTSEGRVIAAVLMVVGIGLVGTITAFVAAWFVDEQQASENAEQDLVGKIDQLLEQVEGLQREVARLRDAGSGRSSPEQGRRG